MDDDSNPYRSPTDIDEVASPSHLSRESALFRYQLAAIFLTCAAFINAFYNLRGALTFLPINILGISCIGLTAASLLFPLLERVAGFSRDFFSPLSEQAAWNAAIYNAFRPAIGLGAAGALLWITWVIAFLEFRVNFYIISYAVGIPAHLLAATVYLPILYGWFKAARSIPENA